MLLQTEMQPSSFPFSEQSEMPMEEEREEEEEQEEEVPETPPKSELEVRQ